MDPNVNILVKDFLCKLFQVTKFQRESYQNCGHQDANHEIMKSLGVSWVSSLYKYLIQNINGFLVHSIGQSLLIAEEIIFTQRVKAA